MPRIVLASRNAKKVAELVRILGTHASDQIQDLAVVGADEVPDLPEVVESGATFAENATLKAVSAARYTGSIAVADDSGLCVDAMNGMPGVLSARWAGSRSSDDANLQLVLDQLRDVPDDRRGAEFRCAATAARPTANGVEVIVREAEVRGVLLRERRGAGGFGYDPIFLPDGYDQTTAELAPEAKDAISHRGKALRLLAAAMRTWWQ